MNKMLTSERKYQDFLYPLQKLRYQVLQTLLVGLTESPDKYSILAPDCFSDRRELECRKSEIVEFYILALSASIDITSLPDIMVCDNFAVDAVTLFQVLT